MTTTIPGRLVRLVSVEADGTLYDLSADEPLPMRVHDAPVDSIGDLSVLFYATADYPDDRNVTGIEITWSTTNGPRLTRFSGSELRMLADHFEAALRDVEIYEE